MPKVHPIQFVALLTIPLVASIIYAVALANHATVRTNEFVYVVFSAISTVFWLASVVVLFTRKSQPTSPSEPSSDSGTPHPTGSIPSSGILSVGTLMATLGLVLAPGSSPAATLDAKSATWRDAVRKQVDAEYPSLESLYRHLHANPELSFVEVNTAALVANELRGLGFDVTEKVGITGVVGVMKNGTGPTLLVRADMDALPMKEETGLSYASTNKVKDLAGKDQNAMHACAHDAHIASFIGMARVLVHFRQAWSGTLVCIAQPAEEISGGARAMLADGLYSRFPKPDLAIAMHVWGTLPAGVIGYVEGPSYANVDSLDLLVRGYGGHGARPHLAKDPILLAAEIITALQSIVSRELEPGTPAVISVGSIHGGTKHNIIPDEVKLQLTLRSYDDAVADHLVHSIGRISTNLARAAGIPESRLPVITHAEERLPVVINDPDLTRRVTATFKSWFSEGQVVPEKPTTGGEDFAMYGRTAHKVPLCMWWVGGQAPANIDATRRTGAPMAANHSALFAPVPEPTIKSAVISLTAAVLDLMPR